VGLPTAGSTTTIAAQRKRNVGDEGKAAWGCFTPHLAERLCLFEPTVAYAPARRLPPPSLTARYGRGGDRVAIGIAVGAGAVLATMTREAEEVADGKDRARTRKARRIGSSAAGFEI
jgi:hypothetical protein